jgi:hypothetical protein
MRLKEELQPEEDLKPNIHRNYCDFIKSDIPKNSIELNKNGHIISNKNSLLKFVDFLLSEYDFLPESKEEGINLNKKKSKKKNKKIPYHKLSLKQKKKRIQNIDHSRNGPSEYPI